MERLPDDELISAYLDDELSAEDRAHVERLLAERPEARRLLDELRGVRESLQALPSYQLDADFGSRVMARAEREVLRPTAVTEIVRNGARPTDAPPTDGAGDPGRWRRPLMWSIVVVAAAVVLMFFDRRPDANRNVAVNQPAAAPRPPHEERFEAGEAGGGFAAPAGDDGIHAKGGGEPAFANDELGARSLMKNDAAGGPAPKLSPNPPNNLAIEGGQMRIDNVAVPSPGAMGGRYSVTDPVATTPIGKAGPPGLVGNAGGGQGTTLPAQALNGPNQQLTTSPSDNLAEMQSQLGVVDTTQIVAENDLRRGQTLIRELEDVRRDVNDEVAAYRTFNTRLQTQQLAEPQRWNMQQAASNNPPLVIVCEVPEAEFEQIDRRLAAVLDLNGIADLTDVTPGGDANDARAREPKPNGQPAETEAAKDKNLAAERNSRREEYMYVFAPAQQVQATVDTLRRQTQYFAEVNVEPAPTTVSVPDIAGNGTSLPFGGRSSPALKEATQDSLPKLSESGKPPSDAPSAATVVTPRNLAQTESAPVGGAAAVQPTPPAAPALPAGPAPTAPPTATLPSSAPPTSAPSSGMLAGQDREAGEKRTDATAGTPSAAKTAAPPTAAPAVTAPTANERIVAGPVVPAPVERNFLQQRDYSYGAAQITPLSRAQRFRADDVAAAANGNAVEQRPLEEKASPPAAEPQAAAAKAAPVIVANEPSDADAAARRKQDGENRAAAEGVAQQPVAPAMQQAAQLRGTYDYQAPGNYQEALFIFRCASSTPPTASESSAADLKAQSQQAPSSQAPSSQARPTATPAAPAAPEPPKSKSE